MLQEEELTLRRILTVCCFRVSPLLDAKEKLLSLLKSPKSATNLRQRTNQSLELPTRV